MPAPCTVCGNPRRAEIESAIASGRSEREAAEAFGVGRAALQRHRKHGLAPKPSKRATDSKAALLPKRASATSAERAKNEREALDLRIKGKSYPEIADELGCAPSTAFELVDAALVRARLENNEKAEQLRDLEVARCDAIIASFWDRATDPARSTTKVEVGRGDFKDIVGEYDPSQDKAAATLLKAMERRAALLGLDAEKRSGVSVTIVQHPDFQGITRIIFDALVPFPEARAAVLARMKTAIASRRAEATLIGAT